MESIFFWNGVGTGSLKQPTNKRAMIKYFMKIKILILILFSYSVNAQDESGIWKLRKLNNAVTTYARDGSKLEFFEGGFHLLGGWSIFETPVTNSHHYVSYDSCRTWVQLADAPWSRRHAFGSGVHGGKLRIWGGDGSFAYFVKDGWSYDSTSGWTLDFNDWGGPGGRNVYTTVVHKQWCYILGGLGDLDSANSTWRTEDFLNWTKVADLPAGNLDNLESAALVSFGGDMYLIGGGRFLVGVGDSTHWVNDTVFKSTDDGVTWVPITTTGGTGSIWPNACVTSDRIWFIQGTGRNAIHKKGVKWSYDGITWTDFYQSVEPRHASGFNSVGDDVFIVTGNLFNDAWRIKKLTR